MDFFEDSQGVSGSGICRGGYKIDPWQKKFPGHFLDEGISAVPGESPAEPGVIWLGVWGKAFTGGIAEPTTTGILQNFTSSSRRAMMVFRFLRIRIITCGWRQIMGSTFWIETRAFYPLSDHYSQWRGGEYFSYS